ncbi:MAG: hypothetical protein LBQ30_01200 [Treponema sp.]|nr:hypothetical protein [Treponema sp.]
MVKRAFSISPSRQVAPLQTALYRISQCILFGMPVLLPLQAEQFVTYSPSPADRLS